MTNNEISNPQVYKDQFTSWKPNWCVEEHLDLPSDIVYAAYHHQCQTGKLDEAADTIDLLFSSLYVNGYIRFCLIGSDNSEGRFE